MYGESHMSNYDKEPEIIINDHDNDAWSGYKDIIDKITKKINKKKYVIVIDYYPGVREEVLDNFKIGLKPDYIINSDDIFYDGDTLTNLMKNNLTEDRVFGVMYYGKMDDYIDKAKLDLYKNKIESIKSGIVLICGVGASYIYKGDILIYADLARWEIQLRYRSHEIGNFKANNCDEDILKKYKRSYFIEWRIADKHKTSLFEDIDYLLDTNAKNDPKMISGDAFRDALKSTTQRPFRLVPYFDEGIWGGTWMEKVCGLKKSKNNYAWCFDGVPEENSLYFRIGIIRVEVPSLDLVLYQPEQLLGEKVYSRFGAQFPIRFDFLDTINGGNLSLQVHPDTQYANYNFGISYTQDESYYILDAQEGANVYLGLKNNIDKQTMINELKLAERGEITFDAEKYVNKFSAKAHDHFLIPAGTIHCSGAGCMILEISATPYIFTFKLWDWGRVGLDGIPRPTHVNHGEKVIKWNRTTDWVNENLVNNIEVIVDNEYKEERTGLNELEFIETRRYLFEKKLRFFTNKNLNVLNLIDGDEAIIESTNNSFKQFIVHYAETFIIPAFVEEYTIRPIGLSLGKEISVIKAYVRF